MAHKRSIRHQKEKSIKKTEEKKGNTRSASRPSSSSRKSCCRKGGGSRSKELVVATWVVRIMVDRGSNGTGHAEDLLLLASKYNSDSVAH